MLAWLTANIGTIVVALAVAAILALIIRGVLKDRRQGKSTCGCGCKDCPMSGNCHSKT